jgi:hypothetical protein
MSSPLVNLKILFGMFSAHFTFYFQLFLLFSKRTGLLEKIQNRLEKIYIFLRGWLGLSAKIKPSKAKTKARSVSHD